MLEREAVAVEVMTRAGMPYSRGALHRVLMKCHMALGRHAEAADHGEAARACYVASEAPINEARLLSGLAQVYRAVGRVEDERHALVDCVAIYRRLAHKEDEDKQMINAAERRLGEHAAGAT